MYYGHDHSNKLRFYPEFLTTIIPRFFKKDPSLNDYQRIKALYSEQYKHGFSTDLFDYTFNTIYRSITHYLHISVNYNRNIVNNKQLQMHSHKNDWNKQCNNQQINTFDNCPFIGFIIEELCKFRDSDYINIKLESFNLKKICVCYNQL